MAESIVRSKRCVECGEEKPLTEFYKNPTVKHGFHNRCKGCHSKTCYASIRDDPVKWAAAMERQREYRRKHPPTELQREKNREYGRQNYRENKQRYLLNCSKRKARILGGGGSHSAEEWSQMVKVFGGKCLCCGAMKRLTKDHVVPVARGGSDNIENIQPLCLGCNKRKYTGNTDYRTIDKVVSFEPGGIVKRLFNTECLGANDSKMPSGCMGSLID